MSCVYVCVNVVKYLSSVVLDAKLVISYSWFDIVRVCLGRKDKETEMIMTSTHVVIKRLSRKHCALDPQKQ